MLPEAFQDSEEMLFWSAAVTKNIGPDVGTKPAKKIG